MAQDICIIENTDKVTKKMKGIFKEEPEYKFFSIEVKDLDKALKNIPSIIVIDEDNVQTDILELCRMIRNNEDNSITPIIVVSSNTDEAHKIQVLSSFVEYYITRPVDHEYIYYTIKNLIRLIYTNRRISPLTGLPGNVQIQAELKKRLLMKEEFAVLYLDLDNFKAYNDVYGFLAGDEIIKFTANTIVSNVHALDNSNNFVGHIGGDDFVAIVENNDFEEACKRIIAEFDMGVLNYYNEMDIERGYLEVPNRKCILEQFPLTSISIGVVVVDPHNYANTLQIGEVGAQVKHIAKITPGSTYTIDRRKHEECKIKNLKEQKVTYGELD